MGLTVAISTHGGYARYLTRCVQTALEHADEVIVYDDGGECEKPAGARYVALPKSGSLIPARIHAIAEAKGDWLLHLDADDWLVRTPPMPDADISFSDMYLCMDDGIIGGMWDCSVYPTEYESCMAYLREVRSTPFPGKGIYRVAWLREHDLSWYSWPNTTFAEDCRTLIEYLKHRPRVVYTPDEGYYVYRMHEGQDTNDPERRAAFLADLDEYLGARHD